MTSHPPSPPYQWLFACCLCIDVLLSWLYITLWTKESVVAAFHHYGAQFGSTKVDIAVLNSFRCFVLLSVALYHRKTHSKLFLSVVVVGCGMAAAVVVKTAMLTVPSGAFPSCTLIATFVELWILQSWEKSPYLSLDNPIQEESSDEEDPIDIRGFMTMGHRHQSPLAIKKKKSFPSINQVQEEQEHTNLGRILEFAKDTGASNVIVGFTCGQDVPSTLKDTIHGGFAFLHTLRMQDTRWRFVRKESGMTVARLDHEQGVVFRGQGVLKGNPLEILGVMEELDLRTNWDQAFAHGSNLQEFEDDHTKIQLFTFAYPWITPRDACVVTCWRLEETGACMVVRQSIDRPETPGCVRAFVKLIGYVVIPISPKESRLEYYSCIDLQGWIPQRIASMVMGQTLQIHRLGGFMGKLHEKWSRKGKPRVLYA